MVDRQHSAFDAFDQSRRGSDRARVCIRRQSVRQSVGFFDGLVEILEAGNERERTERFFVHGAGIVRNIGEDSRLEEVTLVLLTPSTNQDGGPALYRVFHQGREGSLPALVGERPDGRTVRRTVSHFQLSGFLDEIFDETVVGCVLDEEARRRNADLTGVAVFAGGKHRSGGRQIGIVEYDGRRMTAEFHRNPLHVACLRVQLVFFRSGSIQ